MSIGYLTETKVGTYTLEGFIGIGCDLNGIFAHPQFNVFIEENGNKRYVRLFLTPTRSNLLSLALFLGEPINPEWFRLPTDFDKEAFEEGSKNDTLAKECGPAVDAMVERLRELQ